MQAFVIVLLSTTTSAWLVATSPQVVPSVRRFATAYYEDEDESKNGLVVAGEVFLSSSAIHHEAGQALIRAGQAWTTDWDDVTDAFADASRAFSRQGYVVVAYELEDASTIEGCTSVGPPSSAPNLIAIKEQFETLDTEEFREAARALSELIESL